MQLEDVQVTNGREGKGILVEGWNLVAFQADFGDVLVGDQAFRIADDDIPGNEAKIKKG
jgi:hypothetical protein